MIVAGLASGQGKTSVTAALARKFAQEGKRVRIFKTGADFLDPMILSVACGQPVDMLDLWIVGEEECRRRLARAASEADLILIEGVMGLYDGSPSTADLARALNLPVLAVIDASAMAQTAAAIALGLRDYGPVKLVGVIANRVAFAGHAKLLADAMRDISLLGYLPPQPSKIPERHLGLVQANQIPELDAVLDQFGSALVIDASQWRDLPTPAWVGILDKNQKSARLDGMHIAIARDAAFAFLYPANLQLLQHLGARLSYFSPLADEAVPPDCDAIFLPGGYPELHGAPLSAAKQWQVSIREAHAAGVPIWAECGGMMALTESMTDLEGVKWPMVGLLPGSATMSSRLSAIGPQAWITECGELRGHTFHYSSMQSKLEPIAHSENHPSRTKGEAIYRVGSLTASYFHAYFPSCPDAVVGIFTHRD